MHSSGAEQASRELWHIAAKLEILIDMRSEIRIRACQEPRSGATLEATSLGLPKKGPAVYELNFARWGRPYLVLGG